MNGDARRANQCCGRTLPVGGIPAADFAALDALALKLTCLDGAFAPPLRELGRILGGRIAAEHECRPLRDALDALIPSCGLEGVLTAAFLARTDARATLELQGCAEALGWPVPVVHRTVCAYDEGLFEGVLRGMTGDAALSVHEVTCLGLGHAACQFTIATSSSAAPEDVHHADR